MGIFYDTIGSVREGSFPLSDRRNIYQNDEKSEVAWLLVGDAAEASQHQRLPRRIAVQDAAACYDWLDCVPAEMRDGSAAGNSSGT